MRGYKKSPVPGAAGAAKPKVQCRHLLAEMWRGEKKTSMCVKGHNRVLVSALTAKFSDSILYLLTEMDTKTVNYPCMLS